MIVLLNLLPIPKLDGWQFLGLVLNKFTDPNRAKKIRKWGVTIVAILFIGFATWHDIVHLRVVEFFIELLG